MIVGVADTHAALWLLYDDDRLSSAANAFFDHAASNDGTIAISSISLVEIVYLVEKGRIDRSANELIRNALDRPDHIFAEHPVNRAIADFLPQIAREQVPDMPDRIIAATSLQLGVPLITRDGRIRASNVSTIW